MSIINQMLKDIDAREKQPNGGQRAAYIYSGKPLRSRNWLYALAGVILVVLIFGVLAAWQHFRGDDSTALPTAEQLRIEPSARASITATSEQTEQPEPVASDSTNVRTTNVAAGTANQRAREVAQPVIAPSVVAPGTDAATIESAQSNTLAEPETSAAASTTPAVEVVSEVTAQVVQQSQPEPEPAGEMNVQRSSSTQSAATLYRRGLEALDNNDIRQAMQRFQEALALEPNHHDARLQLAALSFGRGFAGDALQLLQEGVQRAPQNHAFVLLKARIYERIDQPEYALQLLSDVAVRLPNDADLLLQRANLASDLGHYSMAVESYQTLLQWRPEQGNWWIAQGFVLEQLAQQYQAASNENRDYIARAREAYRRALQDPTLSSAAQEFAAQQREALGY
ncbi:MAG: tetratricopeptide repeat protein [Idiomarina sp.]|nr:tetratricopeptide repeat protein [Idiomarina sp.]